MNPPKLTDALTDAGPGSSPAVDTRFFGHPRGLATLFFTEMWERFSYYGMRAFLLYYMTASVAAGGLGFTDAQGASAYGTYTGSAWGASIIGGLIADRILGQYRSVLWGGVLIMLGHISLVFPPVPFFYAGLSLVVAGTGLLKPSVSSLVGSLYEQGDRRRDAGFSIFYMGINSGAILGPIIAGYIAQRIDWHLGFGCAAVGMALGLSQYVLDRRHLRPAIERMAAERAARAHTSASAAGTSVALSAGEWSRILAIFVLFAFATLFWAGYEQAGSSLALIGDRNTRLELLGIGFPSSWLQSLQPIFVVLLAPVFAWMWLRLGPREPSVPTKFAFGLMFMGLAFVVMMPAGAALDADTALMISPWPLIFWNLFSELAELSISPVGLSAITKLSPARLVGLMMGVWFLSLAFGNKLAGSLAAYVETMPLYTMFSSIAGVLLGAAVIMFLLVRPVRRLMGNVK
jgi:proton-dependent oligopeptide transporter, POT family